MHRYLSLGRARQRPLQAEECGARGVTARRLLGPPEENLGKKGNWLPWKQSALLPLRYKWLETHLLLLAKMLLFHAKQLHVGFYPVSVQS